MSPNDLDKEAPIVYVNGKRHILPAGKGEWTLLQYLREIGLKGTKLGCGEGGCGACTVMISNFDTNTGKIKNRSVNACLSPLYSVEGCHVVTVEGIGNSRSGLHPVQEKLAKSHGSQCGFCTPGFVMSMYSLLRSNSQQPTEEEIEENLAGNLCRCTGYRPILEAFRTFARTDAEVYTRDATKLSWEQSTSPSGEGATKRGSPICPGTGQPCTNGCGSTAPSAAKEASPACEMHDCEEEHSWTGVAEPIFPPELRRRVPQSLQLPGPVCTWLRPLTLQELLSIKQTTPSAKLIVGNTEVGIEVKFKHMQYPVLVAPTHVPELNVLEVREKDILLGASVTLTQMRDLFKELIKSRPAYQTCGLAAVVEQLRWFAGNQIRNVSSLAGNIVTGSPISDLNPLWMAMGATFIVQEMGSELRKVPATDFFLGYRKVDLRPAEVLVQISVPFMRELEYVREFKQAHRREDDIAIVNAGMRIKFELSESSKLVAAEVAIAYGGMAAKTVMAKEVATAMQGKEWDTAALQLGLQALPKDVPLAPDVPGGMSEFRSSLAASFLYKFFVHTSLKLLADAPAAAILAPQVAEEEHSAAATYSRGANRGLQYTEIKEGAVEGGAGTSLMHCSADMQVTGEAQYTDDIKMASDGLHAALVFSEKPHAKLLSVDAAEALAMEGVAGFFSAKDVPGGNDIGPVLHDEQVFATDTVTCVGQVIGVVVAETEQQARGAALAVKVTYEDLPAIMSIEEAIEAGSFYTHPMATHKLECGNVEACFASPEAAHVLEGEMRVGGQEHFYLEPNCCVVTPVEGDEITMVASTQCPMKHQKSVAHTLGLPMNKVQCKTKRIGGGFGGKETRSVFLCCAAAVPAYLLQRPVRLCLDRDEDMMSTGQRHAFVAKYKVACTAEGKLLGLHSDFYNNAGNSLDLSHSIMDRCLFHCDNSYKWPNLRAVGHCCYTHQSSNTAFRGFGGPQGMMLTEMIIERVATAVGKTPEAVRQLNLYKEGEVTHYGQTLELCRTPAVWSQVMETSCFTERRAAVDVFNRSSRWRKRGLAVTPTKFGISFTTTFLNQAGSLVHIYTDGTVLVTHGGVEMGQGLHTKMAQVAATSLGIPISAVFISETNTDKVPNASPTAASASSDMYGGAILDACTQLNERLAPLRLANPTGSFKEIVNSAYMQRIDLSAHGFYRTPDIHFDWETGSGRPFNYLCYGAACTEVEVDCLTGDSQVLRADIVMDVGTSLNPAIDVGQVEGGFVQGMGWVTMEELVWGDKQHKWVRPGHLFTRGPGTYKIPTANDIPVDMRVALLKDAPNPRAVYSSKAVGEPPFHLAASVFFAMKDAIGSARRDAGHSEWFQLDSPATPERIRMACADSLTAPYASPTLRPKQSA